MRARDTVMTIPDTPRYTRITLAEHGEHVLRTPTFAASAAARGALYAVMSETDADPLTLGWSEELSPGFGACIGASWWHPELELQTQRPALGAGDAAWQEYGDQVCDELIEQGYSLTDMTALGLAAKGRVELLLSVASEAQERADFSSGPDAGDGTEERVAGGETEMQS